MTEWILTDDASYQWQRKDGDEYEMCDTVCVEYVEGYRWFAGHGTFRIADYDQSEIDHALRTFGYMTMGNLKAIYGDRSDDILAECLFENCMADFWCEQFETEAEAHAWIDSFVKYQRMMLESYADKA